MPQKSSLLMLVLLTALVCQGFVFLAWESEERLLAQDARERAAIAIRLD